MPFMTTSEGVVEITDEQRQRWFEAGQPSTGDWTRARLIRELGGEIPQLRGALRRGEPSTEFPGEAPFVPTPVATDTGAVVADTGAGVDEAPIDPFRRDYPTADAFVTIMNDIKSGFITLLEGYYRFRAIQAEAGTPTTMTIGEFEANIRDAAPPDTLTPGDSANAMAKVLVDLDSGEITEKEALAALADISDKGGTGAQGVVPSEFTREQRLRRQEAEEPLKAGFRGLLSRPGFQQSSGAFQDYMQRNLENQYTRFNLANRFDPLSPGQSFADFVAAGQPTSFGDVQGGLSAALAALQDPSREDPRSQALLEQFLDPQRGAGRQFAAALQPGLMNISPSLRGAFAGGLSNVFERQQALDPSRNFLTYAREKGYF